MTKSIPIRYNLIWANIYIVVGVFCSLFFAVSGVLLNQIQILIYAVGAIVPIVVGFIMRKSNYALVSKERIQAFGLFGQIRKNYVLKKGELFVKKSNRIYIQKGADYKKVSMNNWFINLNDWKRAMELFESNEFEKLTKHLIDD